MAAEDASRLNAMGAEFMRDYFDKNPYFVTAHHLDSFDSFLNELPSLVRSMNPISMVRDDTMTAAVTMTNQVDRYTVNMFVGEDGVSFDHPVITDKRKASEPRRGRGKDKDSAPEADPPATGTATRPLYPSEARLRDLTYGINIYADLRIEYTKNGEPAGVVKYQKVNIGFLPLLVHSSPCYLRNMDSATLSDINECAYDRGGYFIIDGREKVVVSQEERVINRLYVRRGEEQDKNIAYKAFIRCIAASGSDVFPRTTVFRVRAQDAVSNPGAIRATVTHISGDIPIFVLFRALGVESDRDILSYIFYDIDSDKYASDIDFLRHSLLEASKLGVYGQQAAIDMLAPRTRFQTVNDLKSCLINNLFPNTGTSFHSKALLLGGITRRIVATVLGREDTSVLDDYSNKRIDTTGAIMSNLFRDMYNQMRDMCVKMLNSEFTIGSWRTSGDIALLVNPVSLKSIVQPSIVKNGILRVMKGSDAWQSSSSSTEASEGVVQDLNRVSYLGYISHIRRVNNPVDRSVKMADPHKMLASHWGVLCPTETPDGPNIGLLTHLATMCMISVACDAAELLTALIGELTEDVSWHDVHYFQDIANLTQLEGALSKVYVNDTWVAATNNPKFVLETIRKLRRAGSIKPTVSVAWSINRREVNIRSDSGRCCRPLIVLGEPGFVVEYVDVEELLTCLVAMDARDILDNPLNKYTHLEINPANNLSVVTNTYPLLNHNPAGYNILCLAQFKQAIGTYATSFRKRMDTIAYVLDYPQRPLVGSMYADRLCGGKMAHGENLVVAIGTYSGYNMEDSVLLNLDAVQRGRLGMTYYSTERYTEELDGVPANPQSVFANPARMQAQGFDVSRLVPSAMAYAHIDAGGIPAENAYVRENEVIVGKVKATREAASGDTVYADASHQLSTGNDRRGKFVDCVLVYDPPAATANRNRGRRCKVRFRQPRPPELGDKMGSRFGQKGVVGMLMPARDMPFSTTSGLVPDIILNPNAFPKRMTVAHMLECVLGRACAVDGVRRNATIFAGDRVVEDTISRFQEMGDDVMYNGRTGEQMRTNLFIGVNYYGRFKHMVEDKYQYRTRGAMNATVRQPAKSAATGASGGLRIGEMEQNAIISHGMSGFMRESFMDRSDKHTLSVDRDTGTPSWSTNQEVDADAPDEFVNVHTPYAFKLLQQELQSLGIDSKLLAEVET